MALAATATRWQNVPWFLLLAGWGVTFGPMYVDLGDTIWRTDEQFHGVLVLLIVIWLIWERRRAVISEPAEPRPIVGSVLFGIGLLLYVLGRSQDILIFAIGAQVPVLAGALLIMQGKGALRSLWFPILYLVFMVPLPSFFVDAVTAPLKQWISVIAENVLYFAGYPIARSGVTLTIGPYQLLVADACSGLHSMFSLSALGLLYMYLVGRAAWLHNLIMASTILPIAFAANIARVMILVLITYHLGDEAGQGFLHQSAGVVLIITALLFFFLLDGVLSRLLPGKKSVPGRSS